MSSGKKLISFLSYFIQIFFSILFRKNSRKIEEKNNDDETNATCLPYLQIEYAQFTPSFSKCNIGKLIEQPKGVQYNEWVATNCMITFLFFYSFFLFFQLFLFIIILIFYMKS